MALKAEIITSARRVEPYDPREHTPFKFLYYADNVGGELLLISESTSIPTDHKYILDIYGQTPLVSDLKGAGCVLFGKIRSWSSYDQQIDTPDELKPRILELLGI